MKSALSKYFVCKRHNSRSFEVEAPLLPFDRLRDAFVFEVIGVDTADPLYLKSGENVWVCIFTCAVFRAVHFELLTGIVNIQFYSGTA